MNAEQLENERPYGFCVESEQGGRRDDRKAASMDMQPEQHPHPHFFTLRVWEEALGEGQTEWRGRVQEIASGETQFFRDWPGLIAALQRLISNAASIGEGSPHETLHTHENDG